MPSSGSSCGSRRTFSLTRCVGLAAALRDANFSRMVWKVTYSDGFAKMPMKDANIMPPKTGVPTFKGKR